LRYRAAARCEALSLPRSPDDMPLPEPLMLLDALLRGTVLALLLLLAAVLGRERSPAPVVRLGMLMALGLAVQVVAAMPWVEWRVPGPWQAPLVAVSVGNAVLFWLFVRALFDDDFAPRRRHALTWGLVAGLSGFNCLLLARGGAHGVPGVQAAFGGLGGWAVVLQRVLPLVFAGLAIVAAARHWRGDLVEGRRRLRLFILLAGSAYTLVQLALRLSSADGRLSPASAGLDIVLTLAMVATIAVRLLRLGASELLPTAPPATPAPAARLLAGALARDGASQRPAGAPVGQAGPVDATHATHAADAANAGDAANVANAAHAAHAAHATHATHAAGAAGAAGAANPAVPPEALAALAAAARPPVAFPPAEALADAPSPPDPADDRLADALDHAMRAERLYRGEALTIASLAAHLAVPEYRLRRVINQRLGHRNFNAFVNAWRLQDTFDALADPRHRDRPVLTIALDAGFQSIGPFNRAFKAATGLTPSEFRQQKLADS
jgi:AraC-like DNA-binding protein